MLIRVRVWVGAVIDATMIILMRYGEIFVQCRGMPDGLEGDADGGHQGIGHPTKASRIAEVLLPADGYDITTTKDSPREARLPV